MIQITVGQTSPMIPKALTNCRNLVVSNLTVVSEPDNSTTILGKVKNNSTYFFGQVKIVAEFYDRNNHLVAVESTTPEFAALATNESSPFKLTADILNQSLAYYDIRCGGTVAPS
jgi:hypothetical protein